MTVRQNNPKYFILILDTRLTSEDNFSVVRNIHKNISQMQKYFVLKNSFLYHGLGSIILYELS